jgi:hypothetical protein
MSIITVFCSCEGSCDCSVYRKEDRNNDVNNPLV